MNIEEFFFVGIFLLFIELGIICLTTYIYRYVTRRKRSIVFGNSEKIQKLQEINEKTEFKVIPPACFCSYVCHSKREFDHFSYSDYVVEWARPRKLFLKSIEESAVYNRRAYREYENRCNSLVSTITVEKIKNLPISITSFRDLEEVIFRENKLSPPVLHAVVECTATYDSPGGRNHYFNKKIFSIQEIEKLIATAELLEKQRQSRQSFAEQERAKMTLSLRYDILKRDGFKCQICGMSAQDGVTLHVDHITPVSKGGKTIPSNLRTLCFNCNMGKSDKM